MRFITDINIAQTVIRFLRHSNYDVLDIKTINPKITDIEIIKLALKEKSIVLTQDKDFEVLTQYPKYQVGTIVMRLVKQNAQHSCERLKYLLEHETEAILNSSLTILTEEGIELYPY